MANENQNIIGAGQDTARRAPKINTVTCGDCLEVMQAIPDKSVDMVLCDLPYGATACSWDTPIPLDALWLVYNAKIKPTGAVVLFGSQPFYSTLVTSNLAGFREEMVWMKNRAASGFGNRHLKIHENIAVFSAKTPYIFNAQPYQVTEDRFLVKRRTFGRLRELGNEIYGVAQKDYTPDTGNREPISILAHPVPFTPQKSKTYGAHVDLRLHPTQKPVALCEYLIRTYSNEGDTVLDNCIGSGTTAIACINTGRNYMGIEKEEKYCRIAEERIHALRSPAQNTNEICHTAPNIAMITQAQYPDDTTTFLDSILS
jgi:site-specific DNA-methyltransferase (adenine-specific)